MQYHIEKNTVQETLVIPLYGRKMCSERYPNLFYDGTAAELMERIDYDFGTLEERSRSLMQRFGFLEAAMRQKDLAWEVRDYLRDHPGAAVKLMLKTWIKDAKIRDVGAYFSVADAKRDLAGWSPDITPSSRGYMLGYDDLKDPAVSPLFRTLARVGDGIMKMQIVRLDFGGKANEGQ